MLRSHTCGELRKEHQNQPVQLAGWVHRVRDIGGVVFVTLRDRYGLTQLVFHPDRSPELTQQAQQLHPEWVISVSGVVGLRPEGMANPDMPTGDIEVEVNELNVLNESKVPPILVDSFEEISDELRLKHRFLDLRTSRMQRNITLRSHLAQLIRNYAAERGFLDIETPVLMKSTPEGARDYLVPSRKHPGKFFALPQSPQTLKQLLMISGFDRYLQIVRCFRDEDLRGNRQPEFTQIDMEMTFVEEDDIFEFSEGLMSAICQEILDWTLPTPLPRMKYDDSLRRFGTDKPDLRFGMEIQWMTEDFRSIPFNVFQSVIEDGGEVAGLVLPGQASCSRKDLDNYQKDATEPQIALKGILPVRYRDSAWVSPLTKVMSDEELNTLFEKSGATKDDLFLIAADKSDLLRTALGRLRNQWGKALNLIPEGSHSLLWVVEFPLLAWDEESNRWMAEHHPFTAPLGDDLAELEKNPAGIRARAYDLVMDGHEIASGSIRIHRRDIQNWLFNLIGIDPEQAEKKFGYLLNAFDYGAPPHGGIAFGYDRLVMILCGEDAITDVIAFPKTTAAMSLMEGAPSEVDAQALKELHLKLDLPPKN